MLQDGKIVKDIKIVQRKFCPIYKLVCQANKCMFYDPEGKECYIITLAKVAVGK